MLIKNEINKLVSIIVPIYNSSAFLEKNLNSLRKQTYKNIEIICVDDGSTDHSFDIITRIASKDKRLKLLKQKNLHAGVARNNGLSQAKGQYVLFVDSDDLFSKRMVATFVKAIERDDSDIVVCGYCSFTKSLLFKKKNNNLFLNETKKPVDFKDSIFQSTIGAPWNKFYKMDFVKKNKLYFF